MGFISTIANSTVGKVAAGAMTAFGIAGCSVMNSDVADRGKIVYIVKAPENSVAIERIDLELPFDLAKRMACSDAVLKLVDYGRGNYPCFRIGYQVIAYDSDKINPDQAAKSKGLSTASGYESIR